jgi:hypothetical protein
VRSVIKTTGIWWAEPHGIDQTRTARFSTDRRRHLMSLLTMLGPSPDWCIGMDTMAPVYKNIISLSFKVIKDPVFAGV